MPVSKQERRNRHESAETPTLKRGNPSSSEGRVGTQQFRNIAGKGLVHMVRTETGWNEMSTSQTSTTAGDKVDSVILTGSSGTGGGAGGITSGGTPKNITNSYTGSDTSVQDVVFVDTPSNAYIRGVRSQNNNLSITIVDSLDYGSYINFNAISGTGIESVQSYNEVSNSYDTAVGANTNLKFASDYDSGASTGIFFTATDSGNDTVLTPTILFPPDTNTTYTTSWVDSSANAILRLTPSSGSNDDLTLVAGSNIYLTPVGDNLTIAANNTTNYSLVNSTGNPTGSHTFVMTSSGTEGRLRALKPGNNITMTTTDTDSDTSYVTLNADLSGATISTSEVNPLGGYLTYSASNMRFLDGTGITWALVNQGSGVIELTPTVTITDTNTQNVFASSWVDSSDDVLLRLTKSGASSGTQDIKLVAGSNIYLTPSGADMTIAANNTTNYALTNSSSSGQQATLVTVNTGTSGKLRGFKQGSNITISSTDDGLEGNGYITIAANLSAATISTSYTNPLGGYLTQTTGNLRFVDNGKITWALAAQGSNVTTVTPTIASYSASDVGAISTSHAANSISSTHITVLGNTSGTNSGNVCTSNHTGAGYLTGNQTVTLSGDVTGSGTTSIACTVVDDSHNHVQSNVDGLSTSLAAKADLAGPTFTADINVADSIWINGYTDNTASRIRFHHNGTDAYQDWETGNYYIRYDNTTKYMMDSSGNFHADADIYAYSTSVGSDKKLKKNIKDIKYGLSDVMKLRGVDFDWKEKRDGVHDIGVIAQEVREVIPEVVKETEDVNGEKYLSVDYSKLVPVLIEAIKELSERKCGCGV